MLKPSTCAAECTLFICLHINHTIGLYTLLILHLSFNAEVLFKCHGVLHNILTRIY